MGEGVEKLLQIKRAYRLSNDHVADISGYSRSAIEKWFSAAGKNRLKTVVVEGIEARVKSKFPQGNHPE